MKKLPNERKKKDFASSLNRWQQPRETGPIVPYLSKKKFEERFAKRKERNVLRNQRFSNVLENQPNRDDDCLPF